ncbi:Hypothetical predicted protein [Podarcis lilfordi]|uniref:Uncharacterized protein n=1 Tax=Podarcis lilfordi TaxID=74358 RepID=A0AA35KW75_9SAUR|nr:Hypothetical predicted protein [Podarcis lilfordi]
MHTLGISAIVVLNAVEILYYFPDDIERSASGSASNERLPIMAPQVPPQVPPQLLPQFPPPLPAQPYPPQIPPQPYPPQMIPIYVTYDPAQGLPSILSNLPGVVNPGAGDPLSWNSWGEIASQLIYPPAVTART